MLAGIGGRVFEIVAIADAALFAEGQPDLSSRFWRIDPPCTVSEFADRNRVLADKESSEPGRWRTSRTPYLRDIQDAIGDESIDEVVIVKPAQVGGSEATRNGLLYWGCCAPGPCLIVFPDEGVARKISRERLRPLIEGTPVLAEQATDIQATAIRLSAMDIFLGWSGSPSSLAARPCRYVILDEVDKYPAFSGRDADPIALARARTRTWRHRRKVVILSTPTTTLGHVWRAWKKCGRQMTWNAKCPECGHLQPLQWSSVRWPKRPDEIARNDWAEEVEITGQAWYECRACLARWDTATLRKASKRGEYVGEGDARSRRTGFRFNSLASPWVDLPGLVAKWLQVQGDPADLMEFVNQELGEPWEDQVKSLSDKRFEEKRSEGWPRGIVPAWAGSLVAGIDTQKGKFYWLVRAVGRDGKSRLIDNGTADTFEDLNHKILRAEWPIQGVSLTLPVSVVAIDSGGGKAAATEEDGSRTDEVYRWSETDPRIRPCKGHGGVKRARKPITQSAITYKSPQGGEYKVSLTVIDPDHYKDLVANRIGLKMGEPAEWQVHDEIDEDYVRQMICERKVIQRRGSTVVMTWVPSSKGAANHYWDCEILAAVGAEMIGAHLCADEADLIKERREIAKMERERKERLESGTDSFWQRPGWAEDDSGGDWARPWADGKDW